MDPFHDYTLDIEGLPDERTAPSVVQVHNQIVNVTVPEVAEDGPWDCSILFTGMNSVINGENTKTNGMHLGGMMTVPSSGHHLYTLGNLSRGQPFGALNISCIKSGATLPTGAPDTIGDNYIALGSVLTTDRCRLIGVAVEVTNVTPEFYKSGSLTVAMLPDSADDAAACVYTDSSAQNKPSSQQLDRVCKQACTVAPLQSVPGSQTWDAKKGVYFIPRMTEVPRRLNSYFTALDSSGSAFGANSRIPVFYGTDGKTATLEPIGSVLDGAIKTPLFDPMYPSGFSPCQAWFSGLSNNTSLTVCFRTIVEYFPAVGSPLLPLSSPSACFDPKALALYARVASVAPYAVPVGMNAAGDYFKRILNVMGQAALLVAPIFGEFAPVAVAGGRLLVEGSKMIKGSGKKLKRDEAGANARLIRRK